MPMNYTIMLLCTVCVICGCRLSFYHTHIKTHTPNKCESKPKTNEQKKLNVWNDIQISNGLLPFHHAVASVKKWPFLHVFFLLSPSLSSSSALFPWMNQICVFFSLSHWFGWISFNNFCLILLPPHFHSALLVVVFFMCCYVLRASVSFLLLRIL